jgi:predicted permease
MDFHAFASDVRLTLRLCRRGWIATCSAILLLGTGVSVAVLGHAVAQEGSQQGVAAVDRIGLVGFGYPGRDVGFVPRRILAEVRAQARSFAQVVAIQLTQTSIDSDQGEERRITLARVTDGFFELAGVSPVVGRPFAGDEYAAGGLPVLVLSHQFWRTHFDGDPSTIGTTLALAGTRYTVVGVMPAGFVFPQAQAWTPGSLDAVEAGSGDTDNPRGFVRLRSDVTWDAARAEVAVLARHLAAIYPEEFRAETCPACAPEQARALSLQSRREQIARREGQMFLLFQAPTLLLLATTLVSVAGLTAVRTLSRRSELVTRLALGATRIQLVRHFVLEGMVLAIPAALCGLALLRLELWYLSRIMPPAMQWLPAALALPSQVSSVVGGCAVAAIAITSALAAGSLWRLERSGRMPSGMTSHSGFRAVTLRDLPVVLQVAVAGLTLTVAALLAGLQTSITSPYFGFKTNQLLAVSLALTPNTCARDCRSHLIDLAKSTSERLRQIPGVVNVTAADTLPQPLPAIGGEGRLASVSAGGVDVRTRCLFVDQDFFPTLAIGVVGREIGAQDVSYRRQTLIVSDALAKSLWKSEDPIGRAVSVRVLGGSAREFVVIGIAPDLNYLSIDSRSRRTAYLPLSALPSDVGEVRILVRAASNPEGVLEALRAALSTVDRKRALRVPETYDMARARGSYRDIVNEMTFVMGLMLAVSIMAVAIAVAGVAGVTLSAVFANQKTLAIRAALGASPGSLVALVLRSALLKVLAGVLLVTPVMAVPFLGPQEVNDPAWDPLFWNLTWWSVMLCGGAIVSLGCYLPARIAARTDLATLTRQT